MRSGRLEFAKLFLPNSYDRAIDDFDEAIRLDPRDSRAYFDRGTAWCRKRDFDRGIADFDDALRLDPKFALAWYNRGCAWQDKGDQERADADFDEARRLDPSLFDD